MIWDLKELITWFNSDKSNSLFFIPLSDHDAEYDPWPDLENKSYTSVAVCFTNWWCGFRTNVRDSYLLLKPSSVI